MPITVTEKWESRQTTLGDQPSVELLYIVDGTDDDVAAHAALLTSAPTTYGTLLLQSSHIERIAEYTWEGSVKYGTTQASEAGDSQFNFDTGGGTQHITQSLSTINSYAPSGGTAPDHKGAIGATGDTVEGVDITVPVYNFSETHYFDDTTITGAYKLALFGLTGKVNNATFKGLAAGEVLFLGASGSKRGEEPWEITYKFAGSPNVTGLTVGDITGIAKNGWEYLWVRYADTEDSTAHMLVKRPIAAYVEQVYQSGDFSGLGIGV